MRSRTSSSENGGLDRRWGRSGRLEPCEDKPPGESRRLSSGMGVHTCSSTLAPSTGQPQSPQRRVS